MNKDFWRGKRVVITGGAAMIGTHLARLLLTLEPERVTIIDDLSSGRLENIHDKAYFRRADLRRDSLRERELDTADVVFHLACAHGGRGYVDTHPVESYDNLSLDATVFRTITGRSVSSSHAYKRAGKIPRVVYASSACAYPIDLQDSPHSKPLHESDIDYHNIRQPDGAYGFSKLAGELTLNAYTEAGLLDGVACRMFTVFGPLVKENHAIAAFCAKTLIRQDPFEIWGDGTQLRNWTYVEDTVRGLVGAAESGMRGAVNIGSEERYTVLQGAASVWAAMGWKPKQIVHAPSAPTGPYNRIANATTAYQNFGWQPEIGFAEGIRRTVAWYLSTHNAESVAERLQQSLKER